MKVGSSIATLEPAPEDDWTVALAAFRVQASETSERKERIETKKIRTDRQTKRRDKKKTGHFFKLLKFCSHALNNLFARTCRRKPQRATNDIRRPSVFRLPNDQTRDPISRQKPEQPDNNRHRDRQRPGEPQLHRTHLRPWISALILLVLSLSSDAAAASLAAAEAELAKNRGRKSRVTHRGSCELCERMSTTWRWRGGGGQARRWRGRHRPHN